MFDRDPRDQDARERDDGIRDREGDCLMLGRGPGSALAHDDGKDREPRECDRDVRDRKNDREYIDPRDVFSRDLELPRGPERELVRDRDHDYRLNGSDTRTLSSVGAFRVVSERDLRDPA